MSKNESRDNSKSDDQPATQTAAQATATDGNALILKLQAATTADPALIAEAQPYVEHVTRHAPADRIGQVVAKELKRVKTLPVPEVKEAGQAI